MIERQCSLLKGWSRKPKCKRDIAIMAGAGDLKKVLCLTLSCFLTLSTWELFYGQVFVFNPTRHHIWVQYIQIIAHLSLPLSIGWVALSFLFVCCPSRYGDIRPNLTSSCPTPPNQYIFWKLMKIAIQKYIRNTNTKTKTNTKTMTKTKTPRE